MLRLEPPRRAAASLSNPNIVHLDEIGEHKGQHYFSMGVPV